MDRKRTFIKLAKQQFQAEKGIASVEEEHGLPTDDPKEIKVLIEGELDLWNKSNFHKKLGESNSKQRKSLRDVERQLQKTNEEKLEQLKREQEELERKKLEEDSERKPHKEHKATKKATKASEKKNAMNANVEDFLAKAARMETERKEAALRVKQEQEKLRQELEQQAEAERIQIKRAARLAALEVRRQKNGVRSALGLLHHFVLDKKHSLVVVAAFAEERPARLCLRTWCNLARDKRHSKRAEADFFTRSRLGLLLDTFHAIHRLSHPEHPAGLPENWQRAVGAREFSPEVLQADGGRLPRDHELQRLQLSDDASASAAATPFSKQGNEKYFNFADRQLRPPTPPSDNDDFPDLSAAASGHAAPRKLQSVTPSKPKEAKREKAAWPPANFLRAHEEAVAAASSGLALSASPEAGASEEFMLTEAHSQMREGQRLAKQGDLLGALECLEVAMCMRQGALGEGHPLTVDAMFELGSVCLDLGRHQASADLLGRCVEMRRQALGEWSVETATAAYHASIAHACLGARSEALLLMERAAGAFEATVGKGDPRFARALARVLDAM